MFLIYKIRRDNVTLYTHSKSNYDQREKWFLFKFRVSKCTAKFKDAVSYEICVVTYLWQKRLRIANYIQNLVRHVKILMNKVF